MYVSDVSSHFTIDNRSKVAIMKSLKKLMEFVKPYQRFFYALIGLTFLQGVLDPLQPYLVQISMDHYVAKGNYRGLVGMTSLLLCLLLIQVIAHYYRTFLSDWVGQHVVRDIRIRIYAHVLRLRNSFLNKTPAGKLVTINISDTETLANVFSDGLASLIGDLLQMLLIILLMVYINWRLALLSLCTMPLIALITYIFKKKIKGVLGVVRNAVSQINVFLQERILGMSVVQIFGREPHELHRFQMLNHIHQQASIQAVQYYSLYFPLLYIIHTISISVLLGYGSIFIMHGTATFGQLLAFLMYVNLLFRPLHFIADRFNTLQMGIVGIERITTLLENEEQVVNRGVYAPQKLKGTISFQHVWFAYQQDHYVVKDVSFQIEAQKSLAIVGATGAGKSTLIGLLERFYEIQKGTIQIDGVNIQDYELQTLRSHMGLVLQDIFILSGSIYDNITLGHPGITRKRVIEATQLIGIHDFITQLPGGYNYPVKERGMSLSMGQRQLLAFARVLVYDPCILLLDEATSSMDVVTEQLIQKATLMLMKKRTCLLIAHRLATIRHADNILVLRHGRTQEEGTHEVLLNQQGDYAKLYNAV